MTPNIPLKTYRFAIIMCCMVVVFSLDTLAQDDFFDKMLSISDQELEKASDMPEESKANEQPQAEKDTAIPAMQSVPPAAPLPVPPYIDTPVPTQPHADAPVEILMEESPLSDEQLKESNEVTGPSTATESPDDLIEKMLKENSDLMGKAPPKADTPLVEQPAGEVVLPSEAAVPNAVAPENPVDATQEVNPIQKTLSEEAAEIPASLPSMAVPSPSLPVEAQGSKPHAAEPIIGTVMFSPEEYQLLGQAISVYERKTGRQAAVSSAPVKGNAATIAPSTARTPNFYLGSIMYFSPDQWAVWLNNKKYSKDKMINEVDLLGVQSDKVQMRWKVNSLDVIVPDWRSKLVLGNAGNYISRDNAVSINNAGTEITFTLRPNQSFLSSKMKIVEGRPDELAPLVP